MTTRRTFLVAGLGGGAALAAAWWLRGAGEKGAVPADYAPLAALDAAAPAIIAAIVPVMLDGALPTDPGEHRTAVAETVANVARAVQGLPPAAQHELAQLFSLLGLPPTRIALARVTSPWPEASAAAVAAFLDRWRTSHWDLLRSAYDALHQLVFAAWYGNPRSWPAIGYGGPPGARRMTATSDPPRLPDPVRDGVARGWNVIDASTLTGDLTLDADVAIVGTGAGGGTAADILSAAGLTVVMIEEGPLRTSSDFRMRESEAYPDLYQESAARKTRDKAINILQGRCVGGGTTVNWTSSFRTPPVTLATWASAYGLQDFSEQALAPYFARMEERLSIAPWEVAPNANNAALARGAAKIGIAAGSIRRNVKGCWNIGYCGMGCPTNAKQSMLVTTIPAALARNATLVTRARAAAFVPQGDRVATLDCVAMDARGVHPTARAITVRARTFIAAGGAIGTPALLLRSRLPDPHSLIGKRTFLHPTIVSVARMPERIDPFAGAPQTIYSDHFLDTMPPAGPIGYKLEAPPVHPILGAITVPNQGARHAEWMRALPNLQVVIALLRDGFHPDSPGGSVGLRDDGTPLLDYPLSPYVWEGVRRAFLTMAEIQFAAGATEVMPVHGDGEPYRNWKEARAAIDGFALAPLATPVVSAHVMGGAPFGDDPTRAVVDATGRFHHLSNLYVFDGSLFPTSIGANPQLSIYGIVARLADALAAKLTSPGQISAPR